MKPQLGRALASVTAVAIALSGCGSPPPPIKKADKEISEARSSMDRGSMLASKGEYQMALGEYRQASEAISKGKSFAQGNDLSQLNNMKDEVRRIVDELEVKALTKSNEIPKPVGPTAEQQAAEKKQKEEEAKAKAAAEAEAKRKAEEQKKLTEAMGKVDKPKKAEDETAGTPAAAGGNGGGEKAEGDGAEAAPKAAEKAKAKGPYPAVTDASPELQVCKLEKRGNFAWAYVQYYNKTEDELRMCVVPFFKDGNHNLLIDPPDRNTAAFQYDGFKDNVKDMIGDQIVEGMTQNSHACEGQKVFRFVVVGECARANDIKEVAVRIILNNNTNFTAVGK